jgi:hypothetical protein
MEAEPELAEPGRRRVQLRLGRQARQRRGAADDARAVGVQDAAADAGGEAEVVGVDDEPARGVAHFPSTRRK